MSGGGAYHFAGQEKYKKLWATAWEGSAGLSYVSPALGGLDMTVGLRTETWIDRTGMQTHDRQVFGPFIRASMPLGGR